MERVELAGVEAELGVRAAALERAVEAARVVEERIARAARHEERRERTRGGLVALEDEERVGEIERLA